MKKLLILAVTMFTAMSCCQQKAADQESAQCQKECTQKAGECKKAANCEKGEGCCPDKANCPKEGCTGDPATCPQAANCPKKGECQKGDCKMGDCKKGDCPGKVTFVPGNCPANPVNVTAYSDGLQHIGLPTAEVQKTIDFYQGLGFTLATRHDINGRDFAFMKLGNLLIEVIPNDKPTMRAGAVDHICLNVTKIEELYKKIKDAGYKMIDQNIVDIAFWEKGARYFFIEGPNKERIEFCEIVK
jgi:catechol 2,3-dioxygenase-like lactoylglutathione lyase family enzyme